MGGGSVPWTPRIITVVFAGLALLLPSALLAQEEGSNLQTQKEKESYSIGYQVGQSLVRDGVEVDLDLLIQGLRDAVSDTEPRLTDEEMRSLIVELRERSRKEQLRKVQELIVKNAEESKEFLERNAKEEGVRTTQSGLQYVVLKEGEGESPGLEDMVTVHYRGTFIDGEEFDSSYARGEPASFQTDGVIKGWTEVLQMMKVGSKWKVFVPPDLAYGRGGMGERIPPNKVLAFEIELLAVQKESQ
jgi:FKBP-type peptidyl-prolyl cis-trans isomerase